VWVWAVEGAGKVQSQAELWIDAGYGCCLGSLIRDLTGWVSHSPVFCM
jgi:hypothetical protein